MTSECRGGRVALQQPEDEAKKNKIQVLLADLKTCSRTQNLEWGKQVHSQAMESGNESNMYVASSLINMYAKTGSMVDARQVFDRMQHLDEVSWNALIMGYADNGQGLTALDLLIKMRDQGIAPSSVTFVAAFKACTSIATNEGVIGECSNWGKAIHNVAVENAHNTDISVQNTLINMYCKFGNMVVAHQVLKTMTHPTVVSWTTLIQGYAESGEGITALDLFKGMEIAPSSITFVAVLKACSSLALACECRHWVKAIHNLSVECGHSFDIFVQNILIDVYTRCDSMPDAHLIFETIKNPTVVSWTALILGYADCGEGLSALDLFTRMKDGSEAPNSVTFMAALKACTALKHERAESREWGKVIHNLVVENGWNSNVYVQSALIGMYANFNSMIDARQVFYSIKHLDLVSWNALISGYADCGEGLTALHLYTKMKTQGIAPSSATFVAGLKACGLVGALEFGRKIHSEINRGKFVDLIMVICLVDFYAKCGSLAEARHVFDLHIGLATIITWTVLLAGFSTSGDYESVFEIFQRMQDASLHPNSVTFLSVLSCCSHAGLVEKGEEYFEAMSTRYGIIPTVEHYTCLIDIFGRSNKLDAAMALLHTMPCNADNVTWKTVLASCHRRRNVEIGRLAFQSLISLNDKDAAAYVVMGQIYKSRGMYIELEMLMGMRKKFKAWKMREESCWTNEMGEVHLFVI